MLRDVIQKKCVLCMDDNADTRVILTFRLRMNGYEVLSAASCSEALTLAEQQSFNVCIMDSRLPDGSGVELARRFYQCYSHVSVILSTAGIRPTVKVEAEATGLMVIPKPTEVSCTE